MSAEHHHEHAEHTEQQPNELESARKEKFEELRNQPEKNTESAESRAEQAREVINKTEPKPEPPAEQESAPAQHATPFLNYKQNYLHTMASLRRHLSPASRSFSKVIHAPAVEKISEALETTVARPSVIAGATWTALIIGSVFYFTARHFGYTLSGTEMLFSFIVGAIVGITLEGIWRTVRSKHRG
jgi:hypothetical protein